MVTEPKITRQSRARMALPWVRKAAYSGRPCFPQYWREAVRPLCANP